MTNNTIISCFECNNTNNIVYHHVVPESLGGKNTIPLCQLCHDKVHHINNPRNISLSELTKQGLHRAKQRGVKLGNPKYMDSVKKASEIRTKKAIQWYTQISPLIITLKHNGFTKLKDISNELNKRSIKTSENKSFTPTQIHRILKFINNTPPHIMDPTK